MSGLKSIVAAAALAAGLSAAPAMAEDFYAAGCVIREGDFVVATVNKVKNKLQLPTGTPKGDLTPQQTAIMEASEETGVELRLVSNVPIRTENSPNGKIHFYECAAVKPDGFKGLVRKEINDMIGVMLVDPVTMKDAEGRKVKMPWRFSEDGKFLKNMFVPR